MANLTSTKVWGNLNVAGDLFINNNVSIHSGNLRNGLLFNNNILDVDFDNNGVSNKVSRADHTHVNANRTLMGQNTFAGKDSFKQIDLSLTMQNTNYVVCVTPTENPSGSLGEVYVEKSTTNIKIYNSGIFTGNFDWIITY